MALATGSACQTGGDPPGQATPPPPVGPPPELTEAEQAALDGVLEVFDNYLTTFVQLATEGIEFAGGDHYAQLRQYGSSLLIEFGPIGLDNYHSRGWLGAGTVEWELLSVVSVDATGRDDPTGNEEPKVTFRACLDQTGWTLFDAASGEVVEGPGERQVVTVRAHHAADELLELRPEAAWRVTYWAYEDGESC